MTIPLRPVPRLRNMVSGNMLRLDRIDCRIAGWQLDPQIDVAQVTIHLTASLEVKEVRFIPFANVVILKEFVRCQIGGFHFDLNDFELK